jgi:hypothetical protein
MTREEFFLKAVIELSAAQMVAQPGGFKAQMDRAIEIAQYLTTSIYGEYIEPFKENVI